MQVWHLEPVDLAGKQASNLTLHSFRKGYYEEVSVATIEIEVCSFLGDGGVESWKGARGFEKHNCIQKNSSLPERENDAILKMNSGHISSPYDLLRDQSVKTTEQINSRDKWRLSYGFLKIHRGYLASESTASPQKCPFLFHPLLPYSDTISFYKWNSMTALLSLPSFFPFSLFLATWLRATFLRHWRVSPI